MTKSDTESHWDQVYSEKDENRHSWFQADPQLSMSLIVQHASVKGASIIDVGSGASRLVDLLLDAGFSDLTLLDLSGKSLELVRQRLGQRALEVNFVTADVTRWPPPQAYDIWHDRAVFHFLTQRSDQVAYLDRLRAASHAESIVIIAAFTPDGPERCSGLPVQRYSTGKLAERLGGDFVLVASFPETHVTPAGVEQQFTVAVFRRRS